MAEVTAFYNADAEAAVLAELAMGKNDKRAYELEPADFYAEDHQRIFTAMRTLIAQQNPISLPGIAEALTHLYGNDELMQPLLSMVTQKHHLGGAWALKQHIDIIKNAALRRNAFAIIEAARDEFMDPTNDTTAVLDKTRQSLRDMVITGHTWTGMNDVLLNTFSMLERRAKGEEQGLRTGIPTLDKYTGGFHRGELTVIGARPAVGKSALGAQFALAAARSGYHVAICSREMTDIQYGSRIITQHADVDNASLRTGKLTENEWAQITDAMLMCSGMDISFMFSTRYIEDLRMEVQKRVDSGKLDMLMVDYMQLLQCKQKFNKDYERIAYVSKALKDMTTDLNIAIIALAQVGRASEGNMPTLAELRGSGDIEQDADNVIFLHRPSIGDSGLSQEERQMMGGLEMQKKRYVILNIAKQRQGETGQMPMAFNPAKMTFTEIARD